MERERDHHVSIHGSKSTSELKDHDDDSEIDEPRLHSSKSEANLKETHEPKFPVIVFSHGISGNRLCYSTYCSSLASYGFVVVAIEHR